MSKEATLQELGLTHNESKIYLALLEQGCVTAGKVTEKCHLHRANVYDALQKLVEAGLVSFILKENIKYYQVTNPENLNRIIHQKQQMLNSVMDEFKVIHSTAHAQKSEASVLLGIKGFTRILDGF